MADRSFEESLINDGFNVIAGTDEAGRGPLAGPLVVASCILPNNYLNEQINDSKQLSEKKREELYEEIIKIAVDYSITIVSVEDIDRYNIYRCSQKGMTECINKLKVKPDAVISDAMPLPSLNQKVLSIVHGDAISISVAAASILAKVTRDRIMYEYDLKYPEYNFKNNKGYGTKDHIAAIKQYGILPIHRRTYNPVKSMLQEQLKFEI